MIKDFGQINCEGKILDILVKTYCNPCDVIKFAEYLEKWIVIL